MIIVADLFALLPEARRYRALAPAVEKIEKVPARRRSAKVYDRDPNLVYDAFRTIQGARGLGHARRLVPVAPSVLGRMFPNARRTCAKGH